MNDSPLLSLLSPAVGAGAAAMPAEAPTTVLEPVNTLPEKLRKLVLDDATSGIFEKDSVKALMNKQQLANVFLELSKLYLAEAGELTGKKAAQKLNEAAMFANYAMSISHECQEAAKECISKIEIKLYAVLGATSDTKILPMVKHFKERLVAIRKHCKDKLGEIESKYEEIKLGYGEGAAEFKEAEDDPNLRAADEYEIKEVRALYENIAKEIKEFLAVIITECEKILGEPPCKYSVIALGSLALQQFTPYSDLEFAILIEDKYEEGNEATLEINKSNQEYFRNLSQLIHFWVINLGETPIPYSKFNLPLDQYIKCGICFDLGGKTPLGRPDKNYELIQTPFRMAWYLDHKKWSKVDKNLPFILEAVVHITGDAKITEEYQTKIREYCDEIDPEARLPNCQVKARKRLVEGLDEEDYTGLKTQAPKHVKGDIDAFRPNLKGQEDEGRLFDVKKEIYRLPDRLLYNLAMYFGIIPTSVWDAIEQLKVRGIIGVEAQHNLLRAATYATNLRMRIYSHYEQQNESMSVLREIIEATPSDSSSQFRLPPRELSIDSKLARYYYTAIPFQNVLAKAFDNTNKADASAIKAERFYAYTPVNRGKLHKRLLRYDEAAREFKEALKIEPENIEVLELLANAYEKIGDFSDALKRHYAVLKLLQTIIIKDAPLVVASILGSIANIYNKQGNYLKALTNYNEAIKAYKTIFGENANSNVAKTLNNIATIHESQGNYEDALRVYNEALVIIKTITAEEASPMVAMILNNIAIIYVRQEKYENALKKINEALVIEKNCYGEGFHPEVAKTLGSIANIHKLQGNYKDALCTYNEALIMMKAIYCFKDHTSIAIILINIAGLLKVQQKYEDALRFYNEALVMEKRIYEEKAHPIVAGTLINISNIYNSQGKYNDALKGYSEAMKIYKTLFGENAHPDVAKTLNNIATIYELQGKHDDALRTLNEALVMKKTIYGGLSLDVTKSLANIANVYDSQGKYKEALRSYNEALDIMKKIYLSRAHPDVAIILCNIADTYIKMKYSYRAFKISYQSLKIITNCQVTEYNDVIISFFKEVLKFILEKNNIREVIKFEDHIFKLATESETDITSYYTYLKLWAEAFLAERTDEAAAYLKLAKYFEQEENRFYTITGTPEQIRSFKDLLTRSMLSYIREIPLQQVTTYLSKITGQGFKAHLRAGLGGEEELYFVDAVLTIREGLDLSPILNLLRTNEIEHEEKDLSTFGRAVVVYNMNSKAVGDKLFELLLNNKHSSPAPART